MIYDRTCPGRLGLPGLTTTWRVGGALYGALGRLDHWFGAASWREALDWIASISPEQPIQEVQFWGHGNWGTAKIDRDGLDVQTLQLEHPDNAALRHVRDRLVPNEEALWWFRTCETFGTEAGHRFARAFASFMRCRVAGHTYVIAWAQSGLHVLAPGQTPDWSVDEGLRPPGDPERERRALWSKFSAPHTVSFLSGEITSERDERTSAPLRRSS